MNEAIKKFIELGPELQQQYNENYNVRPLADTLHIMLEAIATLSAAPDAVKADADLEWSHSPMTPDLKALTLEIQKLDPTGKITISLAPAHILQFENEVLEMAAKVVDIWFFDGTETNQKTLAAVIRSLKKKEPI